MVKKNYPPLTDAIEQLGLGKFTYKLCSALLFIPFVDGIELTLIAIISPYLKCKWSLNTLETSLVSASAFVGLTIGSFTLRYFGDKIGRRPMLIVTQFLSSYFSLLCIVTNNFIWFIMMRIFVGFGASSIILPNCFLTEYVPIRFRSKANLLCYMTFPIGAIYVTVVAFLTLDSSGQDLRIFLAFCSIPSLLSLLLSFHVPESIRYLADRGDKRKVQETLMKISKEHEREFSGSIQKIINYQTFQKRSLRSFFTRDRSLKTLSRTLMFTSALFNYYSFVFLNVQLLKERRTALASNTSYSNSLFSIKYVAPTNATLLKTKHCVYLGYSDYVQNMIVSVFDLIGTIVALLIVERTGRKKLIVFSFPIVAILYLLLNFKLSVFFLTAIFCVGRAFCAAALPTIGFFIAELFPTSIRVQGVGTCYTLAYFVTLFVPVLIQDVASKFLFEVTIEYAILCVVTSLLCVIQRETTGISLDEKGQL